MTRRLIAVDLVAEIRRLDKRITTATEHITTRVANSRSTLTIIPGIGQLTAGKILARTGPVTRFTTEAHFAAYAGVAPREVSSGDVIRHRLSRGGDRQLNYALHVIALTQISMKSSPGRVFYDRKRSEGKSGKEAPSAETTPSNGRIPHPGRRPRQPGSGPGRTLRNDTAIQRDRLTS